MLQTAAAEKKILSVVGNLDVTQSPATFAQQVVQLSSNRQWVGIRIGSGIFLRAEQSDADDQTAIANRYAWNSRGGPQSNRSSHGYSPRK
jgi:hypothetical protein